MDGRRASRSLALAALMSLLLATYTPGHVAGSGVLQIRGIPVAKNSLYRPDRDFECLDGSRLISFTRVNDDYCDCGDGSDEPGTAACTNGVFYCENTGHKPAYIPSSWVNDGVCDCCDTSDEYASRVECINNCNELGREARLIQQKAEQLAREGNKLRVELVARGKTIKTEHQSRLAKLRTDYTEAELIKKEKELLKKQAEELESIALEKYKPTETEQPATEEAGGEEEEEDEDLSVSEVEDYFKILDSDSSGTITIVELQTRATFDKNRDGVVSEEEALYFLGDKEVTLQQFTDNAWANIKPFLMLEQGIFKAAKERGEISDHQQPTEDLDHEKEEEVFDKEEEEVPEEEHEKESPEPEVQYDEETQALIDEATNARERFQETEKAINELQSEIRQLEEKLGRDYGPEEVFTSLDGECFEYADLEYIYKLCLYAMATQRSKSGGSSVNLGHWNEWVGSTGAKYTKMKYDRGLTCWNGPARSTIVTLSCGTENKLISVTEPSRCEYAMEFSTPALCNPNAAETADKHDEL
ncbi:PREDICTED: glucosidase 2 subunit beta [Cyphomyrmex costatus]|uniref:Glucosidase 2 subunit beta n=1 Tax=Cyphomyrmex costatus TaxID=456900 RepID=A0A195CJ66_9HYME|nr:PREDICTED: glucosidase 2 subunit beta [Cyphomyrmex costatus]KYN00477.1 Glucosidase 2 subunit beta [Cyphomyrmex costatus]